VDHQYVVQGDFAYLATRLWNAAQTRQTDAVGSAAQQTSSAARGASCLSALTSAAQALDDRAAARASRLNSAAEGAQSTGTTFVACEAHLTSGMNRFRTALGS
jgi:hypothetical protein